MGTASSLDDRLKKFLEDPEVPAEIKALVESRLGQPKEKE